MILTEKLQICSSDEPFVSLIYDANIDAIVSCTYSKDTINRSGQIRILDKESLQDIHSIPLTSAAFHLDFSAQSRLYVTGLGDGQIAFFDAQQRILNLDRPQPFKEKMITDARLDMNGQRVVFTDETGAVRVYERENSSIIFDRPNAHSLCGQSVDAWSCEFLNDNLITSGGDDNAMKIWDLRINEPAFINKCHSGGVVRLVKLDNQRLCSGSYDGNLRFFDLRSLSETISSIELGNGVWDFKFLNGKILVANMYGGFSILDLITLNILHSQEMPNELIYGISSNLDFSSIYCSSFTSGKTWHFTHSE